MSDSRYVISRICRPELVVSVTFHGSARPLGSNRSVVPGSDVPLGSPFIATVNFRVVPLLTYTWGTAPIVELGAAELASGLGGGCVGFVEIVGSASSQS